MKIEQVIADEVRIREQIETWVNAVDRRDLDGSMAHHSADIVMFDVPTVKLEGTEAYKQQWLEFFEAQADKGKFKLKELHVVAGSDVAFAYGIIDCADAAEDQIIVRLSIGLKKIDDEWAVLHEHHSVVAE